MPNQSMCIVSHSACAGLRHCEVGEAAGQHALFGWLAKAAADIAAVEGVCLWDADLTTGHKARHRCREKAGGIDCYILSTTGMR